MKTKYKLINNMNGGYFLFDTEDEAIAQAKNNIASNINKEYTIIKMTPIIIVKAEKCPIKVIDLQSVE